MAKRIKNPIETRIEQREGEVIVSLHYGLECDDGLETRRGFMPQLTPAEQSLIEQIADRSLIKISEHEGI